MVPVAGARGKTDARPGSDALAAPIRHQHDLALQHVDELVLLGMGVTCRGLAARLDADEIDPIVV
jgi:hypothetical protein